jgi:hypothetical protein
MVDRVIMLLPEFGLQQSALINQFLIDTGLSNDLRVVLAEYEEEVEQPWGHDMLIKKRTCLGVEALNEKADFYWTLKGTKELNKRINKYRIENGRKY